MAARLRVAGVTAAHASTRPRLRVAGVSATNSARARLRVAGVTAAHASTRPRLRVAGCYVTPPAPTPRLRVAGVAAGAVQQLVAPQYVLVDVAGELVARPRERYICLDPAAGDWERI